LAAPRIDRRLTAILAADVVGYSRLVQRDEQGTLDRLKAHRKELVEPLVAEHGGRVVKLMGDGILCEFPSAVHAVACAVAIQRGMAEWEKNVPEAEGICFRIGINVGDVVHEGGDILGDGVNVAARLQALAEPGGVLLARNVHNQIKDKLAFRFEPMGRHRVKNIAEPVEVWRVAPGEVAARAAGRRSRRLRPVYAAAAALAFLLLLAVGAASWWWYDLRGPDEAGAPPLAGKPSVAVLPFANLSGEAEDAYFADGMTDDLIIDLTKVSGLVVIARNSVFAYKGRPVTVQEIARELGVRYVVEGSVRRAGGRVRINTQLIDTTTGSHLWADRFERSAADVFAVQDEVIGRIVAALAVELTPAEQARLARPPTRNLEAYDYFLRAEQAAKSGHQSELREALALYGRATALDPTFADAFAAHAWTAAYVWRSDFDDTLPGPVARKTAYETAGRALELDAQAPLPYAVLAVLQVVDRRYEEALASARRAVALGPGTAAAHAALALVLTFAGDHAEAVAAVERSLRLDPNPPTGDQFTAALAFTLHGDHARAIELLERGRLLAPMADEIHLGLAVAYAHAGRLEDARAAVANVLLHLSPNLSVEYERLIYAHFRDDQDLALVLDALREAGLPQWPYGFRGDERERLTGEEISRLALGRTWQGRTGDGEPVFLQIGSDGRTALRTPRQITLGTAFVDEDLLCEESESVVLGRARCGPVYRHPRGPGEDGPGYTYVNAEKVLHFSPVE
jgi:TolB-like protein/class 3 adenylate cyclase/Flp pilus assembly protein TadD